MAALPLCINYKIFIPEMRMTHDEKMYMCIVSSKEQNEVGHIRITRTIAERRAFE